MSAGSLAGSPKRGWGMGKASYAIELRQAILEEKTVCVYQGNILVISRESRPRILRPDSDHFEDLEIIPKFMVLEDKEHG